MNNDNVQSLRQLFNSIPIIAFVLLAGCTTAPEKEEMVYEPAAEQPAEAPVAAPAPASPAPAIVAPAEPIILVPNYPERYVVVKGDTLWDISGRFLRDPWRWPEVWQGNPQVVNPHLIFPGDVLMIKMVGGKPVMQVARGPAATAAGVTDGGTVVTPPAAATPTPETPRPAPIPQDESGRPLSVVKLSPQIRVIELEKAIPTIPMDAIRQFLEGSVVVDRDELDKAPYVTAFADEHMSGGTGYRVYVRGVKDADQHGFMVVRPGKEYRDPDTGERLGREALYLAGAVVEREGDVTTMGLVNAKREVLRSDRLIPGEPESFNYNFMPHAPAAETKGRVISVFDAVSQIGQHQVVVLNVGKREGMEAGHVLAVFQDGAKVKDPVRGGSVKLPNERAGTVIIFRTFDKVSYALVMQSTRAIHLNDTVKNP